MDTTSVTKSGFLVFMMMLVLSVALVVNAVGIAAASLFVGICMAILLDIWGGAR